MLNFQRVRQQLIKLSLITLSLSLTLIALPILKQSLAFQAQAAGLTPVIASVSPDSGSVLGGETVTIAIDDSATLIEITAYGNYACALDSTGKAYCWGGNYYGQLGNGDYGEVSWEPLPRAVNSSLSFGQISAGGNHACALEKITGQAYCWGGQKYEDDPSLTTEQSSPVAVNPALAFSQISAGDSHTCALEKNTDQAYCWGSGWSGQLGNGASGDEADQLSPVAVNSAIDFSQISAGESHTCAIEKNTGKAYCWGADDYGQLGDGGTDTDQSQPSEVDLDLSFSQISAGQGDYTCAIENITGQAYCWGSDEYYKLGDDDTETNQSSPVAVNSAIDFSQISAGGSHTCALEKNTGKAYCWGKNQFGQLGNGASGEHGDNWSESSPVPVDTSNFTDLTFSQIFGGSEHTCALGTAGNAYCWGNGDYGRLGDGNSEGGNDGGDDYSETRPVAVNFEAFQSHYLVNFGDVSVPITNKTDSYMQAIAPSHTAGPVSISITNIDASVTSNVLPASYTYINPAPPTITSVSVANQGLTGNQVISINGSNYFQKDYSFNQISGNAFFKCALDTFGKAWCWGFYFNQISNIFSGDAEAEQYYPVAVDSTLSFSQITASDNHACALTTTGQAYCWGANGSGQLGGGDSGYDGSGEIVHSSPVAVETERSFSQISVGVNHTCAIDTLGKAWCWGSGSTGQLGNGNSDGDDSERPVAVNSDLSFGQISAGDWHTCALDTTGKAYCWGSDDDGELGDGATNTDQPSPAAVNSNLSFSQISAGASHTCAITDAGEAYCWGRDDAGQLGDGGDNTDQSSPVAVDSSLSFSQIIVRKHHTCAIEKTTGQAYCWGANMAGQLGNGEPGPEAIQSSPVVVDSDLGFTQIAIDDYQTCGLTSDHLVYCWGGYYDDGETIHGSLLPKLISLPANDPDLLFLDVTFADIPVKSFRIISLNQIEVIVPGDADLPTSFKVTNPVGQYATFIPAGDMEPVISELGSPALEGSFNIETPGYVLGLTIGGKDYPVINHGDGTWSMPEGTINPGLNPGIYDVTINVDNQSEDRASETLVVGGLTILGDSPVDPDDPNANLTPVVTKAGSPALSGPTDILTLDYNINLIIEGNSYLAINNGDGSWSMPAGTINPSLNPGKYDVIVQILTPDGSLVKSTSVADGITILADGSVVDPTSPATGYGPGIKLTSVSNFLFPSLVITLIGAGMLAANRHRVRN